MFSIIGYIFFKDDFLVPVDEDLVGEYQKLNSKPNLKIEF